MKPNLVAQLAQSFTNRRRFFFPGVGGRRPGGVFFFFSLFFLAALPPGRRNDLIFDAVPFACASIISPMMIVPVNLLPALGDFDVESFGQLLE